MKKKKMIATLTLLVLCLAIPGYLAAADDINLVGSGMTETTPGGTVTYTVDLTHIPATYTDYTISVAASAAPASIHFGKSTTPSYDAATGTYTVGSGDLSQISSLTVTIVLPDDVEAGTEFTVTTTVTGTEGNSISDALTFSVKAAENKDEPIPADENTPENSGNQGSGTQGTGSGSFSGGGAVSTGGSSVAAASGNSSGTDTVAYNGSYNNYLESLSVDGYGFQTEFSKTNETYFITVGSDVESLSINAAAEDGEATFTVAGQSSLRAGLNKILVSVTAENGSVRNYRIYVTKEEA